MRVDLKLNCIKNAGEIEIPLYALQ